MTNFQNPSTKDLRAGDLVAYRLNKHMVIRRVRPMLGGEVQITYTTVQTSNGKDLGTFTDRFDANDLWVRMPLRKYAVTFRNPRGRFVTLETRAYDATAACRELGIKTPDAINLV